MAIPRPMPSMEQLLDTIAPLTNEIPWFRGMIYSESGAGKTVLACSAASSPLLIESDVEGWVSLLNHPEILKNVTRMQYKGLSQLEKLCEAIENKHEAFQKYDMLILDTLSSIATLDLDTVLAARAADSSGKDPDVPTQPDYLANTERMRRVALRMYRLPIDIIATAHTREDKVGAADGPVFTRPGFSPKLRKEIEQLSTLVGYMTATINSEGEYLRQMQVHPTRLIGAKSRIGGLPVVIKSPDLGKIIQDWKNTGGQLVDEKDLVPEHLGLNAGLENTSDSELVTVDSDLEI